METVSVIIIEADAFAAADVAAKAKRIGCQVLGIANRVDSAVEMVNRFCPQLALIGFQPTAAADGIMTAKVIQMGCARLPIIFLSEEMNRAAVQRAGLSGPYGFISKPIMDQDFIDEVQRVLTLDLEAKHIQRDRQNKTMV